MTSNISEMIKILEKETTLYNQMSDLSIREREAMTVYSVNDIQTCHKTRKIMYVQYRELEENRFALMSAISKNMQKPVASINV